MLKLRKLLWNNKEKKKVMKIFVAGTGYARLFNAKSLHKIIKFMLGTFKRL